MSKDEIEKNERGVQVPVFKSELEKKAAEVAGAIFTPFASGVGTTLSDIWGGLVGDPVREWRARNLIERFARTADLLRDYGVPLNKVKSIPMAEAYSMFENASKTEDPTVAEMWSALLANAMDPNQRVTVNPAFVATLGEMDGTAARVLQFIRDWEMVYVRVSKKTNVPLTKIRDELSPLNAFVENSSESANEHFLKYRYWLSKIAEEKSQTKNAIDGLTDEQIEAALSVLHKLGCLVSHHPSMERYAPPISSDEFSDELDALRRQIDDAIAALAYPQTDLFADEKKTELSVEISSFGGLLLDACEPKIGDLNFAPSG